MARKSKNVGTRWSVLSTVLIPFLIFYVNGYQGDLSRCFLAWPAGDQVSGIYFYPVVSGKEVISVCRFNVGSNFDPVVSEKGLLVSVNSTLSDIWSIQPISRRKNGFLEFLLRTFL